MPCDNQWCLECYALSIPLPDKNDENEIEFEVFELVEELPITSIYLLENQLPLQLKYFDNHGQGIRPEKAHKINTEYDLRYLGKDTLVLQPKFLTKINLKIAFEIPPKAIVQIASRSLLANKEINIRRGVIDAEYTGNITIMLQNKTDKPFRIEHAEKIVQAIYLPLINILGLQLVNNREQLGKNKRGMQSFGSTGRFTVPHEISIPNVYIPKGMKKFRVTFYNPNNYSIVLLNKLEIGIIHSNIFQDKNPQIVSNFIEIVRYTLLSNPNIIPTMENYHLLEEKLSRINMSLLEPQQQRQLKQLIAEFANIFAKDNNNLEKTDIIQHQIHTEDALPK
ncbi:hypothetical protein G9A89_018040 [Geosiphon pyriformis]|nr:hypothetical protein G9A89_018040 [Geosiphon pyriformis]